MSEKYSDWCRLWADTKAQAEEMSIRFGEIENKDSSGWNVLLLVHNVHSLLDSDSKN